MTSEPRLYADNLLKDDIIIITGSAGLLGKQIAKTVMLSGAIPVITDLDYERAKDVGNELTKLTGCENIPMQMDITCPKSVDNVINTINSSQFR